MQDNFHTYRRRKVLLINSRPLHEEGVARLLAVTRNLPEEWELFAATSARTAGGAGPGETGGALRELRQALGPEHVFELPSAPFSPFTLYELMRFVWLRGIHLIHSHGRAAGVYARLLKLLVGVPGVHTVHAPDGGASRWGAAFGRLYGRGASLLTRRGIVLFRNEYEDVVSAGVFPACKLCCLEGEPGLAEQEAPAGAPEHGQGAGFRIAVRVARHDGGASARFLLQVLETLREVGGGERLRVLVFGGGPERHLAEALLHEHGLDGLADFVGETENPAELRRLVSGAGCYLELGDGSGFQPTALQAMACSVPLVAPEAGACRQILENGCNALLFRRGDAAQAARHLLHMAEHPEEARCLGAGGRLLSGELLRLRELAERIDGVYRAAALPPVSPDPLDAPH